MADYESSQVRETNPAIDSCLAGEVKAVYGEFDVANSQSLADTETIALVRVPERHVIVGCVLDCDDLDSGVTASWAVGDLAGTGAELIAATTVAQAGGIARNDVAGSSAIAPSDSERTIGVTATTAGTVAASGKMRLTVFYRGEQRGK